jgi:phage terminase small subunit
MQEQIKGAEPLENERREKFCQEYIADPKLSITEAGKKAGYEQRQNAWDVYKSQEVQDRIEYLKLQRMEDLRLDQYYVVNNLKTIVERAIELDELTPAIRANELLGKHLGMFSDKVQHTHSGNVDLNLKVVFEDDGETSTK